MNSPETRFSLIGRLADSDDMDAWHEFVQLYQPLIFRIARRRGLQHADAAEVAQEVLTRVSKVVHRWDPNENKGSFRGWLYRITRNLTIDHLRKTGRQPASANGSGEWLNQLADPAQEPSREFHLEYERQLFTWAARRIQCEFRESTWQAFWQTAVEGVEIKQVSASTGLSTGAIYVARSRVMKRLGEEVRSRNQESLG
ncbi:MAG: RNA polymerase sigma factor [Pirellulaceae bacterium]